MLYYIGFFKIIIDKKKKKITKNFFAYIYNYGGYFFLIT